MLKDMEKSLKIEMHQIDYQKKIIEKKKNQVKGDNE